MRNIVLIGMPGAGKSTVGVVLAKRLGFRFLDSDLVIQERYGKLLEELIRAHGVEGFWKIEEEVNASLDCDRTVIATGGSAVYGERAMELLSQQGTILYLKLPYEEIASRVGDLNARGVTVRQGQTLKELYEERVPLYEKYADITIDCEGKELREIVLEMEQLISHLEQEEKEKSREKRKDVLKDKDIREPLFSFLEDTYGKTRIIEEKTMGRSRADIVMVLPSALYGIEIKSDADTYARLRDQVRDYDKYFDANIVVVGSTHGEHIREHVPDYWGIITVEIVDGAFDFYYMRRPLPNTKMNWKRKLELLWRPELAQLQEWNEMPKYKGIAKAKVADKILERVPDRISEETLRRQVSDILFERDYSKVKELLAEYRRGELDKQLEQETDPEKRKALQKKKERAAQNAPIKPKRRYHRRRSG